MSEQADAATKFMERLSSKKAKDKKPSKPGMESSIVLVGDKDELQQDVESLWQKTYQPGIAGFVRFVSQLPKYSKAVSVVLGCVLFGSQKWLMRF